MLNSAKILFWQIKENALFPKKIGEGGGGGGGGGPSPGSASGLSGALYD